jgi:LPS export ABC transporter permease LptG
MGKGRHSSRHLDIYVLRSILPYIFLSLLIVTLALLGQQLSRFMELLLVASIPTSEVPEIVVNLLPPVLIFTVPTAVLAGTLIGFSRMGSDSEIIVVRAVGIGTWNLLRSIIFFSIVVSFLMLYISLVVAPDSANATKQILLQATLRKLDSPVEPMVFNTEFKGKTIYVRDGDKELGQWGRVFVYSHNEDNVRTILTARNGRIDFSSDQSELVLSEAASTILSETKPDGESKERSYVTERLDHLRVRLPVPKRSELIEQINSRTPDWDEMRWEEVIKRVGGKSDGNLRANIIAHRKLTLSLAPLIFTLLGAGFGLRVRRGGRGTGIVFSLIIMIIYYLSSLAGEQLTRANALPIGFGLWFTTIWGLIIGLLLVKAAGNPTRSIFSFFFIPRIRSIPRMNLLDIIRPISFLNRYKILKKGSSLIRWGPSYLDTKLLKALSISFMLTILTLSTLFIIFTLFELWRYVISNNIELSLVLKYLIYLIPFIVVSIAPISTLVSILAVYALTARRSEAIAWWAAGQSTYRLAIPGLLFSFLVGLGLWYIQERIMPTANIKQDSIRAQIKGFSKTPVSDEDQWIAPGDGRLYYFKYTDLVEHLTTPMIFEFDKENIHLSRIINGHLATWQDNNLIIRNGQQIELGENSIKVMPYKELTLYSIARPDVFKPSLNKPSQLSSADLSNYIQSLKTQKRDSSDMEMALAKKRSDPQTPVIVAILGIPLALAFGKRSAIAALAMAIGIGVIFWAVTSGLYQLGASGFLPSIVAAWTPQVIFGAIGLYLFSRSKT